MAQRLGTGRIGLLFSEQRTVTPQKPHQGAGIAQVVVFRSRVVGHAVGQEFLVGGVQVGEQVAVGLLHRRVFGQGVGKGRLVGRFLIDSPGAFQSQRLALPLFPGVGNRDVAVGVEQFDGVVGFHLLLPGIQGNVAQPYLYRVAYDGLFEGDAGKVFVCAARKSEDQGEVPFGKPVEGDRQVVVRTVGNVVGRRIGRVVVAVGVDAEYRKIARVARPHPVVGFGAELAHRSRRATYQADVVEGLAHEEEVAVVLEEGFDFHVLPRLDVGLLSDPLEVFADLLLAFLRAHRRFDTPQGLVGYLLDALDESNGKRRVDPFLGAVAGVEPVFQDVVLQGGVRGDLRIAAVVVGQQQAFGRDHLAGAASSEEHHGILDAAVVHAVDVLGRDAHPQGLHLRLVELFQEQGDPHPFRTTGGQAGQQDGQSDHRKALA